MENLEPDILFHCVMMPAFCLYILMTCANATIDPLDATGIAMIGAARVIPGYSRLRLKYPIPEYHACYAGFLLGDTMCLHMRNYVFS
jgi:hypothetical protein